MACPEAWINSETNTTHECKQNCDNTRIKQRIKIQGTVRKNDRWSNKVDKEMKERKEPTDNG
jgi:hypothetical protein